MSKANEVWGAVRALAPLHLFARSLHKGAKTISRTEVQAILGHLAVSGRDGAQARTFVEVSDDKYLCPTRGHFRSFARLDQTDKLVYVPERSDCDDFALIFLGRIREAFMLNSGSDLKKGLAVGLVHGLFYLAEELDGTKHRDAQELNHAMNLVITSKGSVYLFEPQDDKLYVADARNRYDMILI